jgi:hypothetical protein
LKVENNVFIDLCERAQVIEIKSLKSELELLNKKKNRQKLLKEQERQSFKWLMEQVSDTEEPDETQIQVGKKRKRRSGKKRFGGGWVSEDDLDEDFEDEDAVLTDDLVSVLAFHPFHYIEILPCTIFHDTCFPHFSTTFR